MRGPVLPLNLSLWTLLGGAVGAWLRLLCVQLFALNWPGYPFGMLAVNVLGSFFIGLVYIPLGQIHLVWLKFLIIGGVLGAFTTFSTYALDVYLLWFARRWADAAVLGMGVPVFSLSAVFVGAWCGRRLFLA